jgi:DNA polymerase-4
MILLARGVDGREVARTPEDAKSLGQETTFDTDTDDRRRLRRTLLLLCDGVARRLRSQGVSARTVTLKYRDETFRTLTRAHTLPEPVDSGDLLFAAAWRLFEAAHGRRRVRLLGVSASSLGPPAQKSLFAAAASLADRVRDAVDERFGEGTLTRASLIRPAATGEADSVRRGSRRLRR